MSDFVAAAAKDEVVVFVVICGEAHVFVFPGLITEEAV